MILDLSKRVFETAAKEPGRYTMVAVRLRALDGRPVLEAADGCCLARVWVELEEGEALPEGEVLLAREAFVDAWKLAKGKHAKLYLRKDVEGWYFFVQPAGAKIRVPIVEGEFPRVDAVIPEPQTERQVSFNPDYLDHIRKATGATSVRLELPEYVGGQVTGPMRVVPLDDEGAEIKGAFGVLMPIKRKA